MALISMGDWIDRHGDAADACAERAPAVDVRLVGLRPAIDLRTAVARRRAAHRLRRARRLARSTARVLA